MGNNGGEVGIDNLGVVESHHSEMEQVAIQKKKLMPHRFNFIFFNVQALCLTDMSERYQAYLQNLNENTYKWHGISYIHPLW